MLNRGSPFPLGATPDPHGVNFALAAPHATAVDLCLFDRDGAGEQQRLRLPACTDGVWHGALAGARPGLVYGWRVHGPWAPHEGHRFNPSKVLLDPYAREIVGQYAGQPSFVGHDPDDPRKPDRRDTAAIALKARVAAPPAFGPVKRPRIAPEDRVIYELHVRGQTRLHPQVAPDLRGSYAGLAEPAVLDHLQRLGVTTLSLMPVQHRADEERLQHMGLSNYWGYSTIGWFAPEARYWSGRPGTSPASEFRAMVDAVHARGMEVVIDVVYNHSAETDELGPTLSLRGVDNALYYRLRQDDRSLYENWTGCGNCLDFREPRVVQLAMDSLRFWMNELGVDGFRFDLAPILARSGGPAGERFDPRAPFLAAIAQDPSLSRALLIAEPWDIGPDGYCLGRFPAGWLEWNDRFRDVQRSFWLHGGAGRGEFAHRLLASSGEFDRGGRAPGASVNFVTAHDGFTLRDLVSYEQRHNLANGEGNRDGSSSNHSRNFGVEGDTDDAEVQAARSRAQRTLLAALMFSQGTPMMLAGDELGHTQRGNNNAYCQDNETTWLPWDRADAALTRYVAGLAALRRRAAPLRRVDWWPSMSQHGPRWMAPEGHLLDPAEWQRADVHALALLFDPVPSDGGDRWLLLVNADAQDASFTLPPGRWLCELASDGVDLDDGAPRLELPARVQVPSCSLWLVRSAAPDGATLTNPDPSTYGGDRT